MLNQGGEEISAVTMDKWQPPEEGWVKMNCDAACDKKQKCVGMGVLIRDLTGHVKAARSTTKLGCFEPAVAEAIYVAAPRSVPLCRVRSSKLCGRRGCPGGHNGATGGGTLQEHDLAIS